MAFHHDAEDAAPTTGNLAGNITRHVHLLIVLLAAVGVAAIDHQRGRQMGLFQVLAGQRHAVRVVIGRLATAQDHVAVLVALGLDDGHLAVFVHREEMVRAAGGLDGVGGDLDVPIGAVLESDRCRQAGGQFAVHLALGGARTDGAPGNQVAQVLRRDHVEKFAARRQAQPVDLDQQLACNAQTFVDAKALVQVGVVDQAFPAHGGARLFEIHAHDDLQRIGVFAALRLEAAGVLQRRRRVVDGTGADDHQQAVVLAAHDLVDAVARSADQGFHGGTPDGEKADQVFRRRQHGDVLDAFVVGLAGAVGRLGGLRVPGRCCFGGHGAIPSESGAKNAR